MRPGREAPEYDLSNCEVTLRSTTRFNEAGARGPGIPTGMGNAQPAVRPGFNEAGARGPGIPTCAWSSMARRW